MWWCWNSDAVELFRRLDRHIWEESYHSPKAMLGLVSQKRLEELSDDTSFISHMKMVKAELDKYMSMPTWFDKTFPEYKDKLESIISRFVDLAFPFTEGLVYDVRMQGNYSLKKLVDICSSYSYKQLDIDDGMQAVFNWRDIQNVDPKENEIIIENLKKYCSLDAYGLFLVYRWLIKLIVESE